MTASIIDSGRWNDNKFTLDIDGNLIFSPMSEEELKNDPQLQPFYERSAQWKRNRDKIRHILFNPGCVCHNTWDLSYLFSFMKNVLSIDAQHLDVSGINNMQGMFCQCPQLESIQLPANPIYLTNASSLFENCQNLQNVNINTWTAPCLTDMDSMFSNCSSLTSIDLSHLFDSPNNQPRQISVKSMFENCTSLESIHMFQGTFFIEDGEKMFYNCTHLQTLDLSGITLDFKYSIHQFAWTSTSYMFKNCKALTDLQFFHSNHLLLNNTQSMFSNCCYLSDIELLNCTIQSKSIDYMFYHCSSLTSLHIPGFHTFQDARETFSECRSLSALDLSKWTLVSKPPINYSYNSIISMFKSCYRLTDIQLFKGTASRLHCDNTFQYCESLDCIDLSNFKFPNESHIYCSYMFCGCKSLQQIHLQHSGLIHLHNPAAMFSGCLHLSKLNLSNFPIHGPVDSMFESCIQLSAIQFNKHNESNSFNHAFSCCKHLESLDLTSFNVLDPDDNLFYFAFNSCKALQSLSLMNLDRITTGTFYAAFTDCEQLKWINLFPQFNPKNYGSMNLCSHTIQHCSLSFSKEMTHPYQQIKVLIDIPEYRSIVPTLLAEYYLNQHQRLSRPQYTQLKKFFTESEHSLPTEDRTICMNILYQQSTQ